jgi:hypothetical protein
VVDLYRYSNYSQNDIVNKTRELRIKGARYEEIAAFLGLREKVSFKMDRFYLRKLFGFVTSRLPREKDMYWNWLQYEKSTYGKDDVRQATKPLSFFT